MNKVDVTLASCLGIVISIAAAAALLSLPGSKLHAYSTAKKACEIEFPGHECEIRFVPKAIEEVNL